MPTRNKINNNVQWFVLFGIVMGKYVEVAFIFLLLLFCRKKYKCTHAMMLIGFLFIHFFLMNIVTDYATGKFWQQFLTISVLLVGYYQFYHNYVRSLDDLWKKYMKVALWVCCIGYVQYSIFLLTGSDFIGNIFSQQEIMADGGRTRMTSVFMEPGNFAAFIVPAVAFCFFSTSKTDFRKRDKAVFLTALLLSFTTIGYFMLLTILLYNYRRVIIKYLYIFLFPIFLFMGFVINYSLTDKKVGNPLIDGMLTKFSNSWNMLGYLSFDTLAMSGDLSTFAIFSNLLVAQEAPCRITGTGLGTHELNYARVYKDDGSNWYGINKTDAYSLLTRIFSEFGYIGIVLGIWFLYRYRNTKDPKNIALLFYFISLLIRGGFYFLYGVIFFFYLYYYTSKKKHLCFSDGKDKKYNRFK